MSVGIELPLTFHHLGVKGVIEGDPDGFVSGDLVGTADASGGTLDVGLTWANANDETPADVLVRINHISVVCANSTVTDVRVFLTKTLPWTGVTQRRIIGAGDLSDDGKEVDYASGLWVWSQKADQLLLNAVAGNVDTTTMTLSCQGFYWYMGRLRRRLFEYPVA